MIIYLSKKSCVRFSITIIIMVFAIGLYFLIPNYLPTYEQEEIKNSYMPEYELNIEFLPEKMKILGQQKVALVNNFNDKIKEIHFHIYPNAFIVQGGKIEIKEVKWKEKSLEYEVSGKDKTVLKIMLPFVWNLEEKLELNINFCTIIPNEQNGFDNRLGSGEKTYNIAHFYPILSVFEKDRYNNEPYSNMGDSFFNQISNYNIKIKSPSVYEIAFSGKLMDKKKEGDSTLWNIKAENVREFVFIASENFKIKRKDLQNTEIYSYYFTEPIGEEILDIGKDSLKIFTRLFGKYPYSTLSIVEADFPTGMEYPNLALIGTDYYNQSNLKNNSIKEEGTTSQFKELEFIVAHEIAHQWWYNMIGNDQYKEAWVDESLTQYSTLLYFREKYGEKTFNEIYENTIVKPFENATLKNSDLITEAIDKPLGEFNSHEDYALLVYYKGTIMQKVIHDALGDELFLKMIREYYDTYKFKIAKGSDYLNLVKKYGSEELLFKLKHFLSKNIINIK